MNKLTICFLIIILFPIIPYLYVQIGSCFDQLQTKHQFTVYRDDEGIPKVVAKDKLSLFYGIGYAQAQDRLWNLFIKKSIASGRVAQSLGSEALEMDLEMRNFNFYNAGKMNAKILDPESRSFLQAYSNGLNDYARHTRLLPLQFYLTWTNWQDWTVQDSLAQLAFFSFCLQFDWMYELARQRLLQTVGFELAWKIMPFGEKNLFREVTIISNEELKEQGRYQHYDSDKIKQILSEHWKQKTMPIGSVHMPSTDYDSLGSNAWVIGGNHTFHGKPILANDPHLANMIPSLFYMIEMILVDENNNTKNQGFGLMVDGVPSLSIGINKNFAWGSTASYVDNKDVFHEKVRQNNGELEYQFKGEWKKFEKRKQVFKVRGQQNFVKQFYHTHRGPVIQHLFFDMHFKYGYPVPNKYRVNHTITISSAIYVPDQTSAPGLLNLIFSETYDQFTNCSNRINSPNIDSVYIDQEGNFGYVSVGRVPKRKIPEMGSFLKDGSTDLYDMGEFLNWQEKPKLINPKKGYVAMANNKFAEDSFDLRSSIHEQSTGRSYRLQKIITDKIKKGQKFTFEDIVSMHLDTRDEFISQAFPYILGALTKVRQLWSNVKTERIFDKLQKWNYNLTVDSVQASIYHVWQHQFQESLLHTANLLQQERQAIINHAFFEIYLMNLYVKIGEGKIGDQEKIVCQNNWFNNTQIHPCLTNAAIVFKRLPTLLTQLFKTQDINEWKWGKIHNHVYKSIPFSEIPILKHIWGRSTPAGGNSRTLNVGITTHQVKSYDSVAGSVFRFITDLNRTIFSYDTGESGNIFSPYYGNFIGKNKYLEYVRKNPLKQEVDWRVSIEHLG